MVFHDHHHLSFKKYVGGNKVSNWKTSVRLLSYAGFLRYGKYLLSPLLPPFLFLLFFILPLFLLPLLLLLLLLFLLLFLLLPFIIHLPTSLSVFFVVDTTHLLMLFIILFIKTCHSLSHTTS